MKTWILRGVVCLQIGVLVLLGFWYYPKRERKAFASCPASKLCISIHFPKKANDILNNTFATKCIEGALAAIRKRIPYEKVGYSGVRHGKAISYQYRVSIAKLFWRSTKLRWIRATLIKKLEACSSQYPLLKGVTMKLLGG